MKGIVHFGPIIERESCPVIAQGYIEALQLERRMPIFVNKKTLLLLPIHNSISLLLLLTTESKLGLTFFLLNLFYDKVNF